jgi:hypothetical protein
LDRQIGVEYYNPSKVYLNYDIHNPIGTCTVFMNKEGKYFGKLELENEVDTSLFFYYNGLHGEDDFFNFEGLFFFEKELESKAKTNRIKDMIV